MGLITIRITVVYAEKLTPCANGAWFEKLTAGKPQRVSI